MAMYQQQLPEVFKPGNGKVTGHHSLPNKEKRVKHSGETTQTCVQVNTMVQPMWQ